MTEIRLLEWLTGPRRADKHPGPTIEQGWKECSLAGWLAGWSGVQYAPPGLLVWTMVVTHVTVNILDPQYTRLGSADPDGSMLLRLCGRDSWNCGADPSTDTAAMLRKL